MPIELSDKVRAAGMYQFSSEKYAAVFEKFGAGPV